MIILNLFWHVVHNKLCGVKYNLDSWRGLIVGKQFVFPKDQHCSILLIYGVTTVHDPAKYINSTAVYSYSHKTILIEITKVT